MARAYSHMKPYPRLAYFVNCRINELKEEIDGIQRKSLMWGEPELQEFVRNEKASPGLHNLIQDRLAELKQNEGALSQELKYWQELEALMDLCPKCGGAGEYRVVVECDSSEYRRCETCGGTGRAIPATTQK